MKSRFIVILLAFLFIGCSNGIENSLIPFEKEYSVDLSKKSKMFFIVLPEIKYASFSENNDVVFSENSDV